MLSMERKVGIMRKAFTTPVFWAGVGCVLACTMAVAAPTEATGKPAAGSGYTWSHELPFDPNRQVRKPGFARPEDRAGDFSGLTAAQLLVKLEDAADIGARRKAAQESGDRQVAGKLELAADEKGKLNAQVDGLIRQLGDADPGKREEASMQIARLWRLAADRLIENLGNADDRAAGGCVKCLTLMRDERIIDAIIEKAKTAKEARTRQLAIFALGMMTERSYTLIDRRPLMDEKTSQRLARERILPFLEELRKSDADPPMQQRIASALRFLANPIDCRPKRAEPPPGPRR